MPRYIPPHLRNKQPVDPSASPTSPTSPTSPSSNLPEDTLPARSLEEQLQNTKISSLRPQRCNHVLPGALGINDIHTHYGGYAYPITAKSTLNDSLERPKQLSYIVLFNNANPRWDSDGIIFAKTNIEYLPGYEEAFKESNGGEEATHGGLDGRNKDDSKQHEDSTNDRKENLTLSQVTIDAKQPEEHSEQPEEHSEQPKESTNGDEEDSTSKVTTDTKPEKRSMSMPQEGSSAADQADVNSDVSTTQKPKQVQTINEHPAHDVTVSTTFPPIPVFAELPQRTNFHFAGYFRLARLSFLHPFSADLVRMQQQKWDLKDKRGRQRPVQRDSQAWQQSLRIRWAVLGMEKVEGMQEPVIEKLDEEVRMRLRKEALRERFGDEYEENESGHFVKKKAVNV